MSMSAVSRRQMRIGLLFLAPNILGFLAFTLFPLIASFGMAFTDWDVQRHNMFHDEPLRWVGLDNFALLFTHPDFYHFLGNTFFLMMGLPPAIAGSLVAALLLTRAGKSKLALRTALIVATVVMVLSSLVLAWGGLERNGLLFLFGTMMATILVFGAWSGGMLYRTLFYLPHFTAGVATFVLWKKLYNPQSGPINQALTPALDQLAITVNGGGGWVFGWLIPALLLGVLFTAVGLQVKRLRRKIQDGELGWATRLTGAMGVAVPLGLVAGWLAGSGATGWWTAAAVGALMLGATQVRPDPLWRRRVRAVTGLGGELIMTMAVISVLAAVGGLAVVCVNLPAMAADGLEPPNWLGSFQWSKPAIMIMALWAAIGSNNMILYMAGLTNIAPELYEAADIDGASRWQRFCHVTWPQLAPITFFIAVMSVIHGLQGGFEMARTMTAGGPAGSTTTLSYFIYMEGFETGRLGYASAVAWVLFALVFTISFLNVKFGNRYVND
jgi:multiple sugar transport system permease protein